MPQTRFFLVNMDGQWVDFFRYWVDATVVRFNERLKLAQ